MYCKPLSFLAGLLAAVILLASCAQYSKTLSSPISFAQDDKPYSIAIMKLKGMGISEIEAETLTETLYDSISQILLGQAAKLKVKYSLLERSQMDKILDQFQMQDVLCSDDSCAVTFGRLLSVQRIIIGSVGLVGETYIISCRIVDVESSKVVRSASCKYQGKIDGVIDILPLVGNELLTGVRLPSPIQPSPSQPVQRPIVNAPQPAAQGRAKALVQEKDTDIKMVQIPSGSFRMGSDYDDDARNPTKGKGYSKDERPIHTVTVSAFEMSATEVTVGQFRAFVNDTGYRTEAERGNGAYVLINGKWEIKADASWKKPYMEQGDDHPVVCVSWNDAVAFCKWLTGKTGRKFDLPTEAEWEYACRAGTETLFYTGDTVSDLGRAGWYYGNSGDRILASSAWDENTVSAANCRTHPVGQKVSNMWELFDMHGNVFEWCKDWYGNYTSGSVTNPSGPISGSFRVLRGGSWNDVDGNCLSSRRYRHIPSNRLNAFGFRVVRRPQ